MTRFDDHRFDQNTTIVNNPEIKAVVLKGTIFEFTANDTFPNVKQFDASEFNAESDVFSSVITKKADVTFNTALSIESFDKKNPNQVKAVGEPVNYCYGAFMLPLGDDRLKNMLDAGMNELIDKGYIDEIVSRNIGEKGKTWFRTR
jgi:ABC-type amino acid transport substrate-binding protein